MRGLPESWEETALEAIAHITAGQSPSGAELNDVGEGLPFFQGKAEFGALYPTAKKWTARPSRAARAGAVLLSVRAPVGPTNLAPTECAIGRGLMAVCPSPYLADRYVLWALRATEEQLRDFATGSTFEAVTGPVVRRHVVPVAPAAEQTRIVAAIEAAFAKVDAGEAALARVSQRLRRLRESVLAAAVSGHLVPQDAGEPHANQLLTRIGAVAVPGWYPAPSCWVWAPLGQLLREPLRNGMSAVKADGEGGLPTFSISAVTTGDFSSSNIKLTAGDWDRAKDLWAEPGDIFVQRSNTPELVGTARMYRGVPRAAIFPDLLIRIRLLPEIAPEWLELVLMSPAYRTLIRSQAKGLAGSMPKISQPVLERLVVPIPPHEEQLRIVAEAARLLSVADASGSTLRASFARASALRRSVLKAAFDGRLVAQDPADEPAVELLERVREDLANGTQAGARRSRKGRTSS